MPSLPRRSRAFLVLAITAVIGTSGIASASLLGGSRASAASAAATASAVGTSGNIYVNSAPNANCSDAGSASGSEAEPFCTITAAAVVAQPGQTIIVTSGQQYPSATISASGTPDNPITIVATRPGVPYVGGNGPEAGILVSGAHDVVIKGLAAVPSPQAPGYEVTGSSSGITIDGAYLSGNTKPEPAVRVDAASNVTRPGVEVVDAFNGSPGSIQVVADEYGYFIPSRG